QIMALARARAAEAERARAAEQLAAREIQLRRQREAELVQARQQLERERAQREALEKSQREAQVARDQAAYQRLLDDAERAQAKGNFGAAINALQTARQLRRNDEVERLLNQALIAQARATAEKQGQREKQELERRLAEETRRREAAEREAAKNRELYEKALQLAQQALNDKRYDESISRYEDAGKLFRTDVVLTGLSQAREGKQRLVARRDEADRKRQEEEQKATKIKQLMDDAGKAYAGGDYELAVKLYREITKLSPGNVEALTALSKAEQARDQKLAQARQQAETANQQADLRKLLDGGKANLDAKNYDAAIIALREAVRLDPKNTEAAKMLQDAQKGQAAITLNAQQEAERKRKL